MNERLIEQRDLTVALNEEMESLSVTLSNSAQSVSVRVDGWGALTGLWLRNNAYRGGADALADQIVTIANAAATLIADRQAFLLDEFGQRTQRIHAEPE